MNIEKLYVIASIILDDFSKKGVSNHLQQLATHLQNTINQPQQPNHQKSLSKVKVALVEGLKNASSNKFNIIDISATEELGVYELIGEKLLEKIEAIFSENEITPSIALEELQKLNAVVVKNVGALVKITQGFNELDLQDISLTDEFNLIVRIPRDLMDNNLSGFADSIKNLNSNLLVFSEVSTGTRESFEIGSLSTTDPTLVLSLVWDTGMLMLDVLAKIAAIYSGVTILKQRRQDFIDNGAPEETLDELTGWINDQVKKNINEAIPELVDKHYKGNDQSRKNELTIEARRKALRIAENIDDGYTFDIKPPKEDDENTEDISEAVDEAIAQLNSYNKRIEDNKLVGRKILSLPENDEDL